MSELQLPERTEEENAETGHTAGTVAVFPTRTRLSRILSGNSDFVICIDESAFEGDRLKPEFREDLDEAMKKIEIDKIDHRVQFLTPHPGGNAERLLGELDAIAKSSGFKKSTVSLR